MEKNLNQDNTSPKEKGIQRQTKGLYFLVSGALSGFLSCVLTLSGIMPSWEGFFLYGLSTLAMLLIVYGLYLVFE